MAATYTIDNVRSILGLTRSAVMSLIRHGFIAPSRGPRRSYLFTFQDLVVLRMAKALQDARLPPRRISASMRRLREQLPQEAPLQGLRIAAVGGDIVVVEPSGQWRADDGQLLLAFDIGQNGTVSLIAPVENIDWFSRAFTMEETAPDDAMESYRKAIGEDACASRAYANLGRLLHESGRIAEAEAIYVTGVAACPADPLLYFNFAVLREDQDRTGDAINLYMQALEQDPTMSDAHFNLGLLYETLRQQREAVRHFSAYRKLTAIPPER